MSPPNGFRKFSMLITFLLLFFLNGLTAFKVTGVSGGVNLTSGARPLRYEIHDFAISGPPFDLLILSMMAFQAANQSGPLSYFQISGFQSRIHGLPRSPWDGVPGTGPNSGYCMHNAVPFPVWHRPYMALFEQIVWNYAQDIANAFPEEQRDQYREAAFTFRFPYWDWALYPALPDVVSQSLITINTPEGWQTVDNPLYSYEFQSNATGNGFPSPYPLANLGTTVRWYDPNTGQSNQSAATAALSTQAPTVGGYGHMQYPDFAAFDPVFWLHHANVDRIVAMWQVLNPDTYVVPTVNTWGSYYESQGFIDSATSALAPFHADEGSTMFTADGVRSIKTFGYSYPELPDWELSQPELAANIRNLVNAQYSPRSNATIGRLRRSIEQRSANLADSFGHVDLDMTLSMNVNDLETQWSITVLVERFAFETSYCIDFFMGGPPSNVSSWPTAKNLIGTYAQFGPANVSTVHPDGAPDGLVSSEISMTHVLAAGELRGVLKDLSPESVVPLLQEALYWRARTAMGEEVPINALSGLSISVYSRSLTPRSADDQFPIYGPVQWQGSAIEGKPGGAAQPGIQE
ncbi:hypothetical protein H2202_003741 [Exophiala xenobiotica]|nr:hypothetical protein H2202_003741 [Exophiala xenobiotica]